MTFILTMRGLFCFTFETTSFEDMLYKVNGKGKETGDDGQLLKICFSAMILHKVSRNDMCRTDRNIKIKFQLNPHLSLIFLSYCTTVINKTHRLSIVNNAWEVTLF